LTDPATVVRKRRSSSERRTGLDDYRSVRSMKKLGASILLAVGMVAAVAAPSSAVSLDKGTDGRVTTLCAYCWPTPGTR
jgi:hypothetical protein